MADEQKPADIHGYVFGQLAPGKDRDLMNRALQDQDTFDALWELSDERELLQDPAVRRRALRALEPKPEDAGARAFWGWLRGSAGWFAAPAAVLAVIALAVAVNWPKPEIDTPLSIVTNPQSDFRAFFTLPLRNPSQLTASLGRSPAVFRPGDVIHATVHLARPAEIFILSKDPAGSARLVVPASPAVDASQPAGDVELAFDPAPPTEDIRVRQTRTVRILALPPGVDLRSQAIEWSRIAKVYSAVELRYDILPE